MQRSTSGGKRRYTIATLRHFWYPLCESGELESRPIARSLHGAPVVLFRDGNGSPAALLDRCAHRNVPLSGGRVTGSSIECPYHGWTFDGAGRCTAVPSLAAPPTGRGRRVPAYAVREEAGLVWVYGAPGEEPASDPFSFPHMDDRRYRSLRQSMVIDTTLFSAVENFLDVPHTAYLHKGLFRGGDKREITAIVKRDSDSVEAEYEGEARPSGIAARLLAPGGDATMIHFDRFILPSITQVEYRIGDKTHVIISTILTPEEDFRVRLFGVMTYRLPLPDWLVRLALPPVARRILAQDVEMLKMQTAATRRFGGERYESTDADILGPHVWYLMRNAERNEGVRALPPHEERVSILV